LRITTIEIPTNQNTVSSSHLAYVVGAVTVKITQSPHHVLQVGAVIFTTYYTMKVTQSPTHFSQPMILAGEE